MDNLARSPKVDDALVGLREALASIRRVTDRARAGRHAHHEGPRRHPRPGAPGARSGWSRSSTRRWRALRTLLGSDAPLAVGLASTLADLSEAARSIRDLADFLDRHPNAILTGRPKP